MRGQLIFGIIVAAMLAFGCEKDETQSTAPAPAETSASERAADRGAMDAAAMDTAGPAKKDAAGAVEGAKTAGAEATSAIQGEAQKLLDEALKYIKENKLDLAEQALVKLEGMKAQLPETMQSSIAQARSALDTAKKASGAMPGGMPR
jgi:hypothetical protein